MYKKYSITNIDRHVFDELRKDASHFASILDVGEHTIRDKKNRYMFFNIMNHFTFMFWEDNLEATNDINDPINTLDMLQNDTTGSLVVMYLGYTLHLTETT